MKLYTFLFLILVITSAAAIAVRNPHTAAGEVQVDRGIEAVEAGITIERDPLTDSGTLDGWGLTTVPISGIMAAGINATSASLEKRNPGDLYCCPVANWGWGYANAYYIGQGRNYLSGLDGGNGVCNVGPHSCTRISCSYDAAIWLCNDQDVEIFPSCKEIAADYVNRLLVTWAAIIT